MSERLESFIEKLREEMSDTEIAASLGNGDVQKPEWLQVAEYPDHMRLWDEGFGFSCMGFIALSY